jgi:putative redox protein
LGGAAVIFASAKAKSVKAVATIGAPSDTKHVRHLFGKQIEDIKKEGEAVVQLAGRPFKIKQQFLDDINVHHVTETLRTMRKPIAIMHSPQDDTVAIEHAEKLYHAAMHPKSFVSLDGADHLLMNQADSKYVGEVIAGWSSRYLDIPVPEVLDTQHHVVASLDDETDFTTQVRAGRHYFTADEPEDIGGNDFGPTPYELLSSALATCTVMTLQMYARRKNWLVKNVECHVNYDRRHAEDCENCENDESAKIDHFDRVIRIDGEIDQKQRERMLSIADKCPVHRTLHSDTVVNTKLFD